jgi:tripartite-type tricarboxylate transporter receptor subunit TctC
MRIPWLRPLICTLPLSLAAFCAQAADFPTKPIHIVVGFAPGGASDIVARLLQPELQKRLGQPIVIDNRPGANGNIANDVVARAEPDGYTLLLGNPGPLVFNPFLYKQVPVDPAKAFAPVTQLTESPMVIVVPAKSALNSVADLVSSAKAKPGGLSYGSAGNGSSMHLAGATLQVRTGAPLVHVPYKGSGPAISDLLGGQLDFMPDSRSTTMPFIRDGRLRPLAVTGDHRVADLPQVPTVAEAGVPDFKVTTWLGVVAPAGTPQPVVQRLYQAFSETLKQPAIKARLDELGTYAMGSTPEAFGRAMEQERKEARQLVQQTGMKIE